MVGLPALIPGLKRVLLLAVHVQSAGEKAHARNDQVGW